MFTNVGRCEPTQDCTGVRHVGTTRLFQRMQGGEIFRFRVPVFPLEAQQRSPETAQHGAIFRLLNSNCLHSLERLPGPSYFAMLKPGRCECLKWMEKHRVVWRIDFLQNTDGSFRKLLSFSEL